MQTGLKKKNHCYDLQKIEVITLMIRKSFTGPGIEIFYNSFWNIIFLKNQKRKSCLLLTNFWSINYLLIDLALILLDSGRSCILWARSCQFDAKSKNQKLVNTFSQNFAHMFTRLLSHIWVKKITSNCLSILRVILAKRIS